MVMACICTSTPGRFFLKSGKVPFRASSATSHAATVSPPPPLDPPHPARAPPPKSAAPARPAPPIFKNRRRLMAPLTHLTFLPPDIPNPFRSTSRRPGLPQRAIILIEGQQDLCVRGYAVLLRPTAVPFLDPCFTYGRPGAWPGRYRSGSSAEGSG